MSRFFLFLAAVAVAVPGIAPAEHRPNVILIYTDDQGYGDASCLNPGAKFRTPHLDRLAHEGLIFTDGHSPDTVCTPSRYGLLTGRYSWRTQIKRGVYGAEGPCLIADGRMTLASLLRDHGYLTGMVGKWHLRMDFPGQWGQRDWSKPTVDMPLDKGFDHFWGIPASMNYGVLAWFEGRFAQVPPTLYTRKKPNKIALDDYRIMPDFDAKPANGRDLEVAPDFEDIDCLTRFTDEAIAWLDLALEDPDKPFFLYLAYTSPHKPVIPLPEFRGKSEAGAYGDFMVETDHHVGEILRWLDATDAGDDTLVFFSSDNGPENTWKERLERYGHDSSGVYKEGKRSIYEGGHRVPFLLRWPKVVKPGRTWDGPVCQTDLLATLADMLGAKLPDGAGEDSVSFWHVLVDEEGPERAPMVHHSSGGRFAVRHGKWKLIMPGKKRQESRELYDLSADPAEETNLMARHPEIAAQLEEKLTKIVQNGRSTPGEPQPNDGEPWWDSLTWIEP